MSPRHRLLLSRSAPGRWGRDLSLHLLLSQLGSASDPSFLVPALGRLWSERLTGDGRGLRYHLTCRLAAQHGPAVLALVPVDAAPADLLCQDLSPAAREVFDTLRRDGLSGTCGDVLAAVSALSDRP